MTTIPVKGHTRRIPEKARDPFASDIDARRKDFARKWNVELVGANDDRLAASIADPGPVRVTVESITQQLKDIAKMIGWK